MPKAKSISELADQAQRELLKAVIANASTYKADEIVEMHKLVAGIRKTQSGDTKPEMSIQSTIQTAAEIEARDLLDKVQSGASLSKVETAKLKSLSEVARAAQNIETHDRELSDLTDDMRLRGVEELLAKNPEFAAKVKGILNEKN